MTDQLSGYALRFTSGKYQGGEYPLPADSEIVIGRGGELDIVLVEDMVSRKHAKITIADGKIAIQDLGSTNGTFVNGERVVKSPLEEGDRVLIGTNILRLISAQDSSLSADAGSMDRSALQQMLNVVAENRKGSETTMSGTLQETPLPDVLQMFATMKKSGVLDVSNDEDSGRVYIRDGKIFYAMYNDSEDLDPMKALFRIFTWTSGEFRMGPPTDDDFMLELEEGTERLVTEASRHANEFRKLGDDLPEMEDMVAIKKPLQAPLADLDRDALEVFQLIHNLGFLQSIMDASPFTDAKTGKIVMQLIAQEYVYV